MYFVRLFFVLGIGLFMIFFAPLLAALPGLRDDLVKKINDIG